MAAKWELLPYNCSVVNELHQQYEEKVGADAGKIIEGPSFILQLTQGSPISDDAVHGKYNNVDIVGTAYEYGYMEAVISGITPWPEKHQSASYGQIKLNFKNFPDDCSEVEGSWSAGATMFNSFFATLGGRRILGETYGSGSTGASSSSARTAGEGSSIPGDSVPDPVPVPDPDPVPEGSRGGCYADPLTGEVTCIGSDEEPSNSLGGINGGCYQDPATGQYVCVD